ncbi:MAG: hypothetical protein WB760_26135 [Xanthobacteraceae bacterium]
MYGPNEGSAHGSPPAAAPVLAPAVSSSLRAIRSRVRRAITKINVIEGFARRPQEHKFDFISEFPLFTPGSFGDEASLTRLTVLAIQQTIDRLGELAEQVTEDKFAVTTLSDVALDAEEKAASEKLRALFQSYGSDKSTTHNYEILYGKLLARGAKQTILEVGLGTNNLDVVSSMGPNGKPGASLRAFRDFTQAQVFGADVDRRILFQEELINTFYVDQTDKNSFNELRRSVPDGLDLVIDDGLHAPNANLTTFAFGLQKIPKGGAVVIEDISPPALPLWKVVKAILGDKYQSELLQSRGGSFVFVVKDVG